ncbi:DUF5674 family protein [Patescibacteria group bacterium]|nr:DUF5674 family protein [Patescibacteria group bacterium]
MKIINSKTPINEIKKMADKMFGNLIKAVVDIDKEIMAVDGELHSDEEALLLEKKSKQENLWGINLYPEIKDDDWIEFDSMINLRPSLKNFSRGIDNPNIREKIIKIVNKLIAR